MTLYTSAVTSVHGNRYSLLAELGRGGQGAVFSVEGNRLAVKVLFDRSPRARERLRDQLALVGRLPLEGLPVARPVAQLRDPHVGYVMELLTGMMPLAVLLRPPRGTGSVIGWYLEGGGLQRRLRLLAHTAQILSELHGRGLVYVDPSPQNVFVSESLHAFEVRLIDCDNVRTSGQMGRSLHTPGYGAPELVKGTAPASTLSDAHAFAVMAFEALALTHPLVGDMVEEGEPDLEEQAFAGELPWIDDPRDASNCSSRGIPRALVLSGALREDFGAAFGDGLLDPTRRPGMARWAEHLHRAADRTVLCPACSGSYYYGSDTCPWCDEPRPPFVFVSVLIWDPERIQHDDKGAVEQRAGVLRSPNGKRRIVEALAISRGQTVHLTDRLTHGTSGHTPRLEVEHRGRNLRLSALDGQPWRLVATTGALERTLDSAARDLALDQPQWEVHAGPSDRLHRVLRFDPVPGAKR